VILPFFFIILAVHGTLAGENLSNVHGQDIRAVLSFIPAAIVLGAGCIAGVREVQEQGQAVAGMFAGVIGVTIMLIVDAHTWNKPPSMTEQINRDHALTVAYTHITACNQLYLQQYPERGFARSLEDLGPAGTNCLSAAEVSGSVGDAKIKYEAEALDDGRVTVYHIAPVQEYFDRKYDMETDQSGIVYAKSSDGAVDQYPHETTKASFDLDTITLYCLFKDKQPPEYYPKDLGAVKDCLRSHYFDLDLANQTISRGDTFGIYLITYSPVTDPASRKVVDFKLYARPKEYGRDGLFSFVVSGDRVVHATPQNRVPELTDPEIGSIRPGSF
jgi:hypothetical protein